MKKIILSALALSLIVVSCQEKKSTTDAENTREHEETNVSSEKDAIIAELKLESARKDSILMEAAQIMNEIETNLSQIAYEEGRIRIQTQNIEAGEDPKQFILEEINAINELRLSNENKIASLNAQLARSKKKLKNSENHNLALAQIVETLQTQIAEKDKEIEGLKTQLANLDAEYSEMFDAYLEMAETADEREIALNRAYYSYGTTKELKENGVITKEGGVIGIGRVKKLKEDFNADYFEEIDITQTKTIDIVGKKAELITTHPVGSYTLDQQDEKAVLNITDASMFWSASKYLVVVVN